MDFILNTNNLILLVMFLVSGAMLMGPNFRGMSGGQVLTPAAATLLINRRKAAVIDLRSEDQFKEGHIARAKNLPAASFPAGLADLKLDKENPVILICDSGSRASGLVGKFKKEGFAEVASLEGGIKAWNTAGLPLVK
jgi:rhodanese-related sulfurtransferase